MRETPAPETPVSDTLHPLVWIAIVGFIAWLVIAMWGFDADGYADYMLAVVSGFIFIAVMIPLVLWRVSRNAQAPDAERKSETFGDWAAGDFQTWQGRSKATTAAVEIVIPIAAAAIGMTALAIVFHYAAAHAAVAGAVM